MRLQPAFYLFVTLFMLMNCTSNDSIEDSLDDIEHPQFSQQSLPPPIDYDLDSIIERGVLKAIVVGGPTSFFIYRGESMGFEYELLNRFAEELGVKLELVVAKNFDELGEWLNSGKGDVIAHGMTVTLKRQQKFAFSEYLYLTHQVLVQSKPDNWRKMKLHEIDRALVHDAIELIGDTVSIRNNSSYMSRIKNLMGEIGGVIYIDTASSELSTDELIGSVGNGEMKYTIADNTLAEIHAFHYPNLVVSTPISFSQRASWVLRKNSSQLQEKLNEWIINMKKHSEYYVIYNKYFKNRHSISERIESDYFLNNTGKLSPYDELIKKYAEGLPWDWELLASQVYQESRFDPHAHSWASAHGLLQLMPATARELGVSNPSDPEQSIRGGAKYLKSIWVRWSEIPDSLERIKFTLASYNAGFGHIQDARTLTELSNGDPNVWDGQVEKALLNLTYQRYYSKPEIRYGYVHGIEPVKYVKEIFERYTMYKTFLENQ